jgi:integrase
MQRGFARKRGTTWTAYYYVTDGRGRHQRSRGGFVTKAAAQQYLNTVMAAVQRGELVHTSKLTVGEYLLDRWLPLMRTNIRPTTWDSYKRVIEQHIVPTLGATPLQRLKVDQLDDFYQALLRDGRQDGRGGLAPKTIRSIHNLIHKALRDAERKQLVQRNVASAADPPKVHRAMEMRTWSASELRSFLHGVRDHRLYAAFLLAATTGMRRGEVLGVRWRDIDFAGRRLAIRQTGLSINYAVSFGTPKTARGRRSIALDTATLAALQEHRQRQLPERALLGSGYVDRDLVFARLDGSPVHPDYFSQAFDRAVARSGLPRIRLHDLRHTHATLGLAAGIPPKVMSDRLGHATVAFTQDVYVHSIPSLESDAAERVADLIFEAGS